ncbi:serine hydrolase domain-containing protein [Priestia taiwanensis]|uniref:Beta-lactamase-related domain-containing protein n=1 Tax=Priestia taiwanensis TaxID=1347902 RepID=A0A917EPF6_9BACI|nr:serine hydrolase [Priestia taiwanensis]MBM7362455.1 CubicO group peptidase (beta-lactamase class C family) [Priestia taiwanensis]GGE62334.1 hypothetical protein GCM10007140_10780 [Priestia taiwanensis]
MKLGERINNWIDSYDRNSYLKGSILVASNEMLLVNKGFGMANIEYNVPNEPTTKYRIGSISKSFTAMAIFQLHEKGKLHIDDYIAQYLPHYPNGHQITIYHCLTHSSGIPNYTGFPDFWSYTMRLPLSLPQLIETFKDRGVEFAPGSKFAYSNSGYALLTSIIEVVSGRTYPEYIQENICEPLGMKNTGCDNGKKIIPNLAAGYSFWEEMIYPAHADLSFPLGAYGLYSTTEDLFIWDYALKTSHLLSKDLTEKMLTPSLTPYASGWMVSKVLGRKCMYHWGDISGFSSIFLRFVSEQLTIIFLSNVNMTPAMPLMKDLAKVIFGEDVMLPAPLVPVPSTKKIESITGKYVLQEDETKVLEISLQPEGLYLTLSKKYGELYKFQLILTNEELTRTIFSTEMIHEQLIFHYTLSGGIESIEYLDCDGGSFTLRKI